MCVHTLVHAYINVCIHIYVYIHVCVHTHTHTHTHDITFLNFFFLFLVYTSSFIKVKKVESMLKKMNINLLISAARHLKMSKSNNQMNRTS